MTSRSLSSRLPLNSSTVFKLHQNRLPSTSFCLSTGAPTPVSSIATLLFSTAPPIPEKELIVNGFLRSVRKQKHLAFGALADGSTMTPLQVVMSPEQAHRWVCRSLARKIFEKVLANRSNLYIQFVDWGCSQD